MQEIRVWTSCKQDFLHHRDVTHLSPAARHDPASITAIIGQDFALLNEQLHEHLTPGGTIQQFQFSTLQRVRYEPARPCLS